MSRLAGLLIVLITLSAFFLLVITFAQTDPCEHGVVKAGQLRCYPGWYRSA